MEEKKSYLDNTTRDWKEKYNLPEIVEIREKIKESFKDLVFDDGPHIYYWNGKQIPSVSSIVESFSEKFDDEKMSVQCYEKYHDDPTSKYYKMTADEIKKSWKKGNKDANTQGTLAHAFAENAMHYMVGDLDAIDPMFKDRLVDGKFEARDGFEGAVVKFWNDLPDEYIPVAVENRMYAMCGKDEPVYAGTFDLLMYSVIPGKEGLILGDYKTNKDLYKNFQGKKLLQPFEQMLDSPLEHYRIQQNCYSNCLNEIGYKVLGKRLIWIKKDGTYEIIRLKGNLIPFLLESLS